MYKLFYIGAIHKVFSNSFYTIYENFWIRTSLKLFGTTFSYGDYFKVIKLQESFTNLWLWEPVIDFNKVWLWFLLHNYERTS